MSSANAASVPNSAAEKSRICRNGAIHRETLEIVLVLILFCRRLSGAISSAPPEAVPKSQKNRTPKPHSGELLLTAQFELLFHPSDGEHRLDPGKRGMPRRAQAPLLRIRRKASRLPAPWLAGPRVNPKRCLPPRWIR